ncbi:MAG: hypothetical protein HY954_05100 [Deltaproteobacteria bacterium]|nr:hypothetical protein [Deltaproteobacteria bacterium]
MRKFTALLLLFTVVSLASIASAQDWPPPPQGGFSGGPPPMGFTGDSGSAVSVLSPDSKYIYVLSKGVIHQYSDDLKPLKTASIETAQTPQQDYMMRPPMPGPMGGNGGPSMHISQNGKRLYVISGRSMYLFDALELKMINKTDF